MQHYQIRLACGLCQRPMVIDVISYGTPHQSIQAVTCMQCAEEKGVQLLAEGEIRELKFEKPPPATPAQVDEAFARFRQAKSAAPED